MRSFYSRVSFIFDLDRSLKGEFHSLAIIAQNMKHIYQNIREVRVMSLKTGSLEEYLTLTVDSKVLAGIGNLRCGLHIKTIIVINMNTLCQAIILR